MLIEQKITTNGLDRGEFLDSIGNYCSIQIDSDKNDLWLGVDIDLQNHNSTRMLLTHEQIKALLPILQRFSTTGNIFRKNVRNRNLKRVR